ncbi:MAG: prepilin-type N-terminal cleavage/methylation domain-containing protein [Myxococcales bacterium]|nr:prepilin-type N-terminal cleavage/methylation domain-containing protein [Myxococcales bacterium]MDH5308069.1 prepilin-type N-terminal cleavage/methylation domain-containing protein [Myxococcales bacterium]MDH5567469.1 prepilin-type N-terminal cleavage/methylation domain-containing protein [Myxococcales bacterium]
MPTRAQEIRRPRSPARRRRAARRQAGVSLIEVVVVIGIVAVLMLVAVPSMNNWFEDQRVKTAARAGADLLLLARSEAIRTGTPHVVFFGVDPDGTMMTDPNGGFAPLLAVDESVTVNCRFDVNEKRESIVASGNTISWGVTNANVKVGSDTGGSTLPPDDTSGSTFQDPNGAGRMDWIMFRPDGIPVTFDGDGGTCGNVGAAGKGGGALYITNGKRDYAVVVSPLGSVRVHVWQPHTNSWSS